MPFSPPTEPQRFTQWLKEKHEERLGFYRGRDEQWREDRRLLNQTYKAQEADTKRVMSPEPKNNFRLALDITTSRDPRIQAVVDYQDADEAATINKAERFAKAIYWEIDRRYRRTGGRSWLRDYMSFCFMGGICTFPLADDSSGRPQFSAQLIDPIQVYPEWDEYGLLWVSRGYNAWGRNVKAMAMRNAEAGHEEWNTAVADTFRDDDVVEMVNAFFVQEGENGPEVVNAMLANDRLLKMPMSDKRFGDQIPIQINPTNGQPFYDIGSLMDEGSGLQLTAAGHSYTSWAWETLLANGRQTFKDFDELLSMERKIIEDHAKPRYMEQTRDGMPRFTQQQFRRGEKFTMRAGEEIKGIEVPTSPRERAELLNYYTGALQRTGFSHVAFGSLGIEISGVTLDSLINATQGVVAPFVTAAQIGISDTILSLIDQWHRGRMKDVTLESPAGNLADRWFVDDFTRQDIPKTLKLRVGLQLALPDTLQNRILAARTAMGDNRPLFSIDAAHEHLLQDVVPDSALEQKRMDKDEAHISEEGRALRVIQGLEQVIQQAEAIDLPQLAQIAGQLRDARISLVQQQAAGASQREAGMQAQRNVQGQRINEPPPGATPPEATGAPPEAVRGVGNRAVDLLRRRGRRVGGA